MRIYTLDKSWFQMSNLPNESMGRAFLGVLKGLLLLTALVVTGCAPAAKMLAYESALGSPEEAIPVRAEIIITANTSQIPPSIGGKKEDILGGMENAIEKDLATNLFTFTEGRPGIIARLNLKYLHYEPDKAYTCLSCILLPLWYVGVPTAHLTGGAKVEMVLQHRSGETIASYVGEKKFDKWIGLYYNKAYQVGQKKFITKEALRMAMEDVKKQVITDRETIMAQIGKADETLASSPTELERVEKLTERITYSSYSGRKFTAAVLGLKAIGVSETTAQILTQALQDEMFRTRRYVLVNRGDMQQVFEEQAFTMGGFTDDTQHAVEAGRLLAVQKIMLGSVSKLGATYSISLTLVDVETAQIEDSASEHRKGTEDDLFSILRTAVFKLVSE